MTKAEPTCACGICGEPTRSTFTKRCDRCWEVETRIQGNPTIMAAILLEHPDLAARVHEEVRAKKLRIQAEGAVELWVEGDYYTLQADGQIKRNGIVMDPKKAGARWMARMALMRAALQTAETSLL
jgi:hypothetical protein